MGERRLARSRSRYRRSRRLRRDRRGVVAVIGTLLALLVFFALFGVFLTQYVPLWMEANESALSNQLEASLATLKSGVDDQYILGIPTYSVPFTLNSESVPLLTQPTVATLAYLAGCPGGFYPNNATPRQIAACDFQRTSFTTGGPLGPHNNPYTQTITTNYLQLTLPDRYYVPVTYFFEGDAVAQSQGSSHQVLVVPPPFNLTKSGSTIGLVTSMVLLLGSASTFAGQGSKEVTSSLVANQNVSPAGRFTNSKGVPTTFNATLTFGVHDVCAWYNLLYNDTYATLGASGSGVWTLTGTGATGALTFPLTANVCSESLTTTFDLSLEVFAVSSALLFLVQDQLSFNAGGL